MSTNVVIVICVSLSPAASRPPASPLNIALADKEQNLTRTSSFRSVDGPLVSLGRKGKRVHIELSTTKRNFPL